MSIENWTEAQLRAFIQQVIDSNRQPNELPRAPNVRVDDLLKHNGVKWQPYTMPAARVWRSTDQSIASGAGAAISFDASVFDTERTGDGMWSSGAPTKLTCVQPGIYVILARIKWDSNSSGTYRVLKLMVNGSALIDQDGIAPSTSTNVPYNHCATLYQLQKGDYVEAYAVHGDLSAHSVLSEVQTSALLMMARIA